MTTDTATTTTAASGPSGPSDWREARGVAEATAGRLHDQLERELSPEIWRLVYEYGEAKERAADQEDWNVMYVMVEMIAAHFPAFSPAILCLVQHALDSDFGRGAECGRVPMLPTSYGRSGADE